MAETPDDAAMPLSPGLQEFVESMGLYYEQYDLPRIGGRILGLLMIAVRPLALDDMASTLQVSRASVSTNVRQAVTLGMAQQVSFTGDRRDYYRFVDDAWERTLLSRHDGIRALQRIAAHGLAALGPDDDALDRSRLEELVDFCDFLMAELSSIAVRWRAHRAAQLSKYDASAAGSKVSRPHASPAPQMPEEASEAV